jgi:hypothetical protein
MAGNMRRKMHESTHFTLAALLDGYAIISRSMSCPSGSCERRAPSTVRSMPRRRGLVEATGQEIVDRRACCYYRLTGARQTALQVEHPPRQADRSSSSAWSTTALRVRRPSASRYRVSRRLGRCGRARRPRQGGDDLLLVRLGALERRRRDRPRHSPPARADLRSGWTLIAPDPRRSIGAALTWPPPSCPPRSP